MCTERKATGLFVLASFLCDNVRGHAKNIVFMTVSDPNVSRVLSIISGLERVVSDHKKPRRRITCVDIFNFIKEGGRRVGRAGGGNLRGKYTQHSYAITMYLCACGSSIHVCS